MLVRPSVGPLVRWSVGPYITSKTSYVTVALRRGEGRVNQLMSKTGYVEIASRLVMFARSCFVEYIIVPCTILSSFFYFLKFIIGINQKLLTLKTKTINYVTLGTMGGPFMAPHSLPQPPAALCNPQQPHRPLAAPHSILQPPLWPIAVV
jgi:hypothetical protein